jgi:ankyrin repeat protein
MTLRSILLALPFLMTLQEPSGDRFHQSIRTNDLTKLRALIKEYGVNAPDSRRHTPLMIAAAFGSVEAVESLLDAGADVKAANISGLTALHLAVSDIRKVRLLVNRGADVNAKTQMGRTPLMVAAHTNGASETVRFLLGKGADPKAADNSQISPLLAAVSVNDVTTAKLLLERGADVDIRAEIPASATPLMAAAHNGNAELVELLLARRPSVTVTSDSNKQPVLNGTIQFGSITALHVAALSGNADIVKMLLAAGAPVNAQDIRGMTPLMWSVSTDRPNLAIVRMLLDRGSNTSLRSKADESALDWARKFNNPAVLAELKTKPVAIASARPATTRLSATARSAAERSMHVLQKSAVDMLPKGGCIACHAQPVTHMAAMLARERGWNTGDSFLQQSLQTITSRWITGDQLMLQATEAGGSPDILLYSSVTLAAARVPASWNTDVVVHYLLAKQRAAGNWHGIGASRAPIQDGDFSRTAMSLRTLAAYAIPARKAEIEEHIKRGAGWLAAQTPLSTEDRVMQLLGLHWANANAGLRETRMRELKGLQRPDGGWSQTPHLPSDAYATGQVLYTLRELGLPPADAALQRGVAFLVTTQRDDGSWYVPSRAMKIQPYFESGFPYGHDQWISSAATAWAAMGLSRAGMEPAVAVAAPRR